MKNEKRKTKNETLAVKIRRNPIQLSRRFILNKKTSSLQSAAIDWWQNAPFTLGTFSIVPEFESNGRFLTRRLRCTENGRSIFLFLRGVPHGPPITLVEAFFPAFLRRKTIASLDFSLFRRRELYIYIYIYITASHK